MTPWDYWHSQFGDEIVHTPPQLSKRELAEQAKRLALIQQYREAMEGQGFMTTIELGERLKSSLTTVRDRMLAIFIPRKLVQKKYVVISGIRQILWRWCEGEGTENCIDTTGDTG